MTYNNDGFRSLYLKFGAFMLTEPFTNAADRFPGADKANCVLVMGYVDHERGFTLEVLALGVKSEAGFKFFDGADDTLAKVRIEQAADLEFFPIADSNGRRRMRYHEKIDMLLEDESQDKDISASRDMEFLDDCREPIYVDDVRVCFIKDKLQPEDMWLRISGLEKHAIRGILLDEPYQDFGIHYGDEVAFNTHKTESGKVMCVCCM